MSVSIYCQAHLQGDNQQIEVAQIMNQFEPFIENKTPDGFDVVYDEMNSSHVFIDTIDKTCSNFSINRPCGDERLYQAIYNSMQLGNVICYGSEGDRFIVKTPQTVNHLPNEMREHVNGESSKLIVAHSFDDFCIGIGHA